MGPLPSVQLVSLCVLACWPAIAMVAPFWLQFHIMGNPSEATRVTASSDACPQTPHIQQAAQGLVDQCIGASAESTTLVDAACCYPVLF
jgi:hypothetical protein